METKKTVEEEIATLMSTIQQLKEDEKYSVPARELAKYKRALVSEGFTEEQAMDIIKLAMRGAL